MSAANTALGAEKRIFPRAKLRSKVIFEDELGEGFIYFYSTDLSLGGLFLESDIPLKMGTRIFLSFNLGGPGESETMIRTTGQVVRVEREQETGLAVVGMGVRFVDLAEAAKSAIERYLGSKR